MVWVNESRMNRKHHMKIKNQSWIFRVQKEEKEIPKEGSQADGVLSLEE